MTTVRDATSLWICNHFNNISGSIFEKLKSYDESVGYYESDTFKLLASPNIQCEYCSSYYQGDLTLSELQSLGNIKCEM